jgi:hypothetical protein
MKKFLALITILLTVSFVAFAQNEDEEAQLFGSTRPVPSPNEYNFGQITDKAQHQFVIRNKNVISMTIISVEAPEGVSVTLLDKEIEPQSVGSFLVSIDKNNYKVRGDFDEKIILTVELNNALGKEIKKYEYRIKGAL